MLSPWLGIGHSLGVRQRAPRSNPDIWDGNPAYPKASLLLTQAPAICSTSRVCGRGWGFLSSCLPPAVEPNVVVPASGCHLVGAGAQVWLVGPFFPSVAAKPLEFL